MAEDRSEVLEGWADYWNERAETYSVQNMSELDTNKRLLWRKLILDHAPDRPRLRVLDVGTGPGFFAINLALAGHAVTAVDVTEQMIAHAKENAAQRGAAVDFRLQRGEVLPFADGSFDLVVNRNVLWNLEYPEQALQEWKRVLSPGGRMVLFDGNWYLYLFTEEEAARRRAMKFECPPEASEADRRSLEIIQARIREAEELARRLPLSRERRPAWDVQALERLGMRIVDVIEDVSPLVYDETDLLRDRTSPMFLVCAEKE